MASTDPGSIPHTPPTPPPVSFVDTDSMSNAELFAACASQSMDNQTKIMMGLSEVGNILNRGISWLNDLMKQLSNMANISMQTSNGTVYLDSNITKELSFLGINSSSSQNASELQGDITAVSNYQSGLATQAQKVTTELNNNYQYYNKIVQFVSNTISGQKSVVDQITRNL